MKRRLTGKTRSDSQNINRQDKQKHEADSTQLKTDIMTVISPISPIVFALGIFGPQMRDNSI